MRRRLLPLTGLVALVACAGDSGDSMSQAETASNVQGARILCEAERDRCGSMEPIDQCIERSSSAQRDSCGELRLMLSHCYADYGTCSQGTLLLFDPEPCRSVIDALSACQDAMPGQPGD